MAEKINIGDVVTYRSTDRDTDWFVLDQNVPLEVAWAYVLARCPQASFSSGKTAQAVYAEDPVYGWPDEAAVVIAADDFAGLAIAKSGGEFLLLQKLI